MTDIKTLETLISKYGTNGISAALAEYKKQGKISTISNIQAITEDVLNDVVNTLSEHYPTLDVHVLKCNPEKTSKISMEQKNKECSWTINVTLEPSGTYRMVYFTGLAQIVVRCKKLTDTVNTFMTRFDRVFSNRL